MKLGQQPFLAHANQRGTLVVRQKGSNVIFLVLVNEAVRGAQVIPVGNSHPMRCHVLRGCGSVELSPADTIHAGPLSTYSDPFLVYRAGVGILGVGECLHLDRVS
ncbi:hypothetical protein D9M73_199610 [compost metagenome]